MACLRKKIQRLQKNSNGFTLVEVLIATLIMVVSIVTVTAAVRQFALQREKLTHYELFYTTVLSLRDRIMNDTLRDDIEESGTINGLPYRYQCQLTESANNYIFGEEEEQSGNKGAFMIMLFKVNLEVGGKTVEFYKTQYNKRFATTTDDF